MSARTTTLTYVGVGAIGGHAVELLVRANVFDMVTLVDRDVCELRNLRSQPIARRDVGRRKVDVHAARLRVIDPRLRVRAIASPVEQVPMGLLRASLIATGLDGLAARRAVSRVAWRLDMPWVDAGVRADGALARVDGYVPSDHAGCIECGWHDDQHHALDRRYPCDGEPAAAPTDAPAALGALAASLQCVEILKLLADDGDALSGCQLLVDTETRRQYLSRRERSGDCPFDHERWPIGRLARRAGQITVRDALSLSPRANARKTRLRVVGDAFARRLVCPRCGESREVLRLAARLGRCKRRCPRCGSAMLPRGIDTTDALALDVLSTRDHRRSLHALGLRRGDVFTVEAPSGAFHFEIGG